MLTAICLISYPSLANLLPTFNQPSPSLPPTLWWGKRQVCTCTVLCMQASEPDIITFLTTQSLCQQPNITLNTCQWTHFLLHSAWIWTVWACNWKAAILSSRMRSALKTHILPNFSHRSGRYRLICSVYCQLLSADQRGRTNGFFLLCRT